MKKLWIYVAVAMAMTSCSKKESWQISGTLTGGNDSTMLIIERSKGAEWVAVDTITPDKDGSYSYIGTPSGRPEVYRMRLDGQVVYFPVDSLDAVTLNTNAKNFGTEFTLSGTDEAELLGSVDRKLIDACSKMTPAAVASDTLLKREIGRKLLTNPGGIAAYYIINKRIGGIPMFDPSNKLDRRIIGAVANAYESARPEDPRTAQLRQLYLSTRQPKVVEADEVAAFDIKLYDRTGRERSLLDEAKKSHVVVLNFTNYATPASTVFNNELHKIWQARKGASFDIYQVSVGDEERDWLDASRNLPWTSVYQPAAGDASVLVRYNVQQLPTTYIIVDGELRQRVDDITTLGAALAKY